MRAGYEMRNSNRILIMAQLFALLGFSIGAGFIAIVWYHITHTA